MENIIYDDLVYDFIVENYGLNGWDLFCSMNEGEREEWLVEIGYEKE